MDGRLILSCGGKPAIARAAAAAAAARAGTSGRGGAEEGVGGRRPRERAERTEPRSLSPTRERSMPPPWIRSRGRKTRGEGAPDSKSSPPPKRDGEEEEDEAEGAVGGGASLRISAAPRPFGAAGDHGTGSEPPDPRARLGLASRVVVGGLDGSRGEGTETGWLVAWGVCGSGERRGDGRRTVRT